MKGLVRKAGGTHPRGFGRGRGRGALGNHARRRGGLVRSLRLPPAGSTVMNTAVKERRISEESMFGGEAGGFGARVDS